MNVKTMIDHLKMFHPDTDVYIQTVPDDYALPLERRNIKLTMAHVDEKYGLEQTKLILTAYLPEKQ